MTDEFRILGVPGPEDILEEVRSSISIGMPYVEQILDTIHDAIRQSIWTPISPESHLIVLRDNKWEEGAYVVALRSPVGRETRAKVITCQGDVIDLDDETQLKIGPGKP
jgi:hypothetical protein